MEESSETEDNSEGLRERGEGNKDSGGKWRGELRRARHRPLANTRGVAELRPPTNLR
jgi:hypothetical protein